MRPDLDAPTIALLESGYYDIHHRVQVANGDGTLIDVSDRVHAIQWRDPSPDAPIASRTFEFLRELNDDPATSLAPLIGSDLNVLDDDTTYSALIQLGRLFVHSFAITAVGGARPADEDFYEWCRGRLGTPSWGGKHGNVVVQGLDQGGELQRVKIETATAYSAGTSVENTIQGVLDDNGYSSIVLNVPVATSVVLDQDFTTGIQKSVWEVIQSLAASIGFVCWWRYQADGAADLVLFEPDRDNASSAFTFPRIYDVEKLEINEADLGNVILGQFTDEDGVRVDNPAVVDSTSITKYGGFRRAFWIVEAEDSVIRTASLMTGMQTAALSDLSEPDAEATYRVPPHPGIECSVDVCTFPADDRHYDEAQDFAPFAIAGEHRARQRPVMRIDVRGKPSGGSGMWRTRRQNQTPTEPASVTQISNVVWTEGATTGELDWGVGAKITSQWIGSAIVDSPATNAKWATVAESVLPVGSGEPPVTLTLPVESSGTAQLLLVQIEARYEDPATGDLVVGDVHRMIIHPKVSIPAINPTTGDLADGSVKLAKQFISTIPVAAFVATSGDLPADNSAADYYIAVDTSVAYEWVGSAWAVWDPVTDPKTIQFIPALTAGIIRAVHVQVDSLDALSAVIGTVYSGLILNAESNPTRGIRLDTGSTFPGTVVEYLDLAATGTNPVLKVGGLEIKADGTSYFADEVDKTRRISHHGFRPFSDSISYTAALNNTTSTDALSDFACPLPIPVGAEITAIRFRGAEGNLANDCDATLYRQEDGGTNTAIQAVSITTAATETRTENVSPAEVVDETYTYIVHVEMNYVSGTAPSFQWFEVDYTVPDYRTTL